MMLDKKQIQAIFLFEFKMGCKAAETTCNISNVFGPGTANKHTGQWWFKKFYHFYPRYLVLFPIEVIYYVYLLLGTVYCINGKSI